MVIRNNQTTCGSNIKTLSFHSKKHVIRICDICNKEDDIEYRNVASSKRRHGIEQDLCHSCLLKQYKKKQSEETKRKISKGGIKRFKNPVNKEYLHKRTKYNHPNYKDNRRIIHKGYLARYENSQTIFMHRENYEKFYDYELQPGENVHHINCDSLDNSKSNLALANNKSDHKLMHSSLETAAAKLVKRGIILFDRNKKGYVINPVLDNTSLELSLNFSDIAIKQKENICQSRLDVDIETEIIHGVRRPIGLIAANMSTVCNANFCIELYELGALGILHRALDEYSLINEVKKIADSCEWVAASIGVGTSQFDLAKKIIQAGGNIITIDIAHGFSTRVADLARLIKEYSQNTKIIVGNFTNPDCIKIFYKYVDALKLGIASGLVCETKNTAGCTEGQFSVIRKFAQLSKDFDIPIISDGSIREPADFTKATAAGANAVMAGSIFARCPESAAELIHVDGQPKKIYAGMASRYVQQKWKGGLKDGTCPEGGIRYLALGESVEKMLERYSGALRSGITYAGGKDIKSLQQEAEFIRLI